MVVTVPEIDALPFIGIETALGLCVANFSSLPLVTSVCLVQIEADLAFTVTCCFLTVNLEIGASDVQEGDSHVVAFDESEGSPSVEEDDWSLTFFFRGDDKIMFADDTGNKRIVKVSGHRPVFRAEEIWVTVGSIFELNDSFISGDIDSILDSILAGITPCDSAAFNWRWVHDDDLIVLWI